MTEIELLAEESEGLLKELEGRQKIRGMDYYVPNKVQYRAHRSLSPIILFCGGNRSGKSTFGCMELCYHLTKKYPDWYPKEKRFKRPIRAVISATSFAIVLRMIEPKLRMYLPQGYYSMKRTAMGYLSLVRCEDGSTVDILTLEMDDTAYESADWDFAWEDEPQHQRKRTAIRRGLVDRRGLEVITMTPLTEPWMKEEIVDKADGKRISVFTADIRDNLETMKGTPILSEDAIKNFEDDLTEEEKECRLHGDFFHKRGLIYKGMSDAHVVSCDCEGKDPDCPFHYQKRFPVIGVLDPHDRLPHHMIWAYVDKDDDIYVDYEISVHCELPELARLILKVEKDRGYRMRKRSIDPNFGRKPAKAGSNHSVIQELTRNGVRFFEPCDDVELGHMIVRYYLKYDRSKPVTAVNKPKLFFSKMGCPKTIRSMKNLQYEEWQGKTKGDKNPKEVEKEKDNHGADTVRYLCIDKPRHGSFRDTEYELTSAPY